MTKPLFDAFRDAMLHNPHQSRKEALDRFISQMMTEPAAYLNLLARDYFDRMSAVWTVREEKHGHSFGRTEVSQDKIERTRAALVSKATAAVAAAPQVSIEAVRQKREASKERTTKAFTELKAALRNVILLDLTLPNGKALRHATGAECKKAGGFYAEIARHIKPQEVVDRHLSEADLQNIRARFYQANKAA